MADVDGPGEEVVPTGITREELNQIPNLDVRTKVEYLFQRYEMIRSPLLPPKILAEYGEVVPGLPEKFVKWTEEESLHRRSLELAAFDEVRTLRKRGQLIGVGVAVVGIISSAIVAVSANSAAGTTAAGIIAIVSVGGPFAARLLAARFGKTDGSASES